MKHIFIHTVLRVHTYIYIYVCVCVLYYYLRLHQYVSMICPVEHLQVNDMPSRASSSRGSVVYILHALCLLNGFGRTLCCCRISLWTVSWLNSPFFGFQTKAYLKLMSSLLLIHSSPPVFVWLALVRSCRCHKACRMSGLKNPDLPHLWSVGAEMPTFHLLSSFCGATYGPQWLTDSPFVWVGCQPSIHIWGLNQCSFLNTSQKPSFNVINSNRKTQYFSEWIKAVQLAFQKLT